MMYWEMTTDVGGEVRIEWNENSTFNVQIPANGEWVDVECFTVYGLRNYDEARDAAMKWYLENILQLA